MTTRIAFLGILVLISGCCKEAELPSASRGLYSSDHREKTQSLQILARCGVKAESSVQRIAALMYDKNVGVASAAAYALRKIDSKEARQALETAEQARQRNRTRR
jgi:HEAT repeat protein